MEQINFTKTLNQSCSPQKVLLISFLMELASKYSISVVIPNYNGKYLLEQNIPFVYKALHSSQITDFEIIISDDNSKDDSTTFIKNNYPEIVLIENSINAGFGGNCNRGIFKASKQLIFLLNTDVKLPEQYFTDLLPYFEKQDTFSVMSRVVGLNDLKIQDGAKYPKYQFASIGVTSNYISDEKNGLYSFYACGAVVLCDRKKIQDMGGFCELFNPYYYEDSELGIRAWRIGYKNYYHHTTFCQHPDGSTTISKEPSNKVKTIIKRNKMLLHLIHLNGYELSYFKFITLIKVYGNLLLGKKMYYHAYQELTNKKSAISEYKKELNNKYPAIISIGKVVQIIKNQIPLNSKIF